MAAVCKIEDALAVELLQEAFEACKAALTPSSCH